MKHSHRHIPLLIFSVTTFMVVIVLYWYMYNTALSSVTKAGLARDIVATEQNDQSQAKNLSELASSTLINRSKLPSVFISSDNIVSFITSIEQLGTQAGLKAEISSIDSEAAAHSNTLTVSSAHAHVDANGSWGSVMRFLGLIENAPFAASIDHLKMSASSNDQKQSSWLISFDIKAPVLVQPSAASSTAP